MIGAFALLAGVLLGLAAARLPASPWLLVAAAAILATWASPLRKQHAPRRVALALAGVLLASLATRHWTELTIAPTSADARVLLEARVLDAPARAGAELRFDAEVRILEGAGPRDGHTRRARLTWRDPPVAPRVGERWRLLVRVAPLADTRNFAGPDLERIAFRDRIHLAGRVLPAARNARLALAATSLDGVRARIAARIGDAVADPDAAALLTALAVGNTSGMSTDQWRVFNATGTTHLVAISGLHVTLFALLMFALARLGWRWLRLGRWLDREPFALLLGLVAAGCYALLAGFSVPTQRTWLMLGIFALARLAARVTGAGRTWSLALIAVLLLDPLAPLAAGFWLSFVAVGVILIVGSTELVMEHGFLMRAWSALRLQLSIMLALAPLTIAVFAGVSLAGVWVNLVAIPVVSFVFVPVVLAGAVTSLVAPVAGAALLRLAATLYEELWPALVWAADGPAALVRVAPPPWWYAFALLAALVLLRRWPWTLRLTGLAAVLPLVYAPPRAPVAGVARVSILDAGRGGSALILTSSHALLFDTGDTWNTRGARLSQVALPALAAAGRTTLDELVLPTLDPDRALAGALLANERELGSIRVGGGWPATSLPVTACADAGFHWDGVRFEIFAAGAHSRYCVLRVSVNGHAILLGGDADGAAERALATRLAPGALASDAVIMSRHASSLGSSPEWIEASGAALCVATGGSAASGSRAVAVERWRHAGAEVLDTRRDGAIELNLGTTGVEVLRRARWSRYPFAWRRLH